MDFSKLKLTEMYAQAPGGGQGSLTGTKLTQAANNKASQAAQAPKAMTNTGNNIGMQSKQMSQKTGNITSPNVQKPGGAPAKMATTAGPQNVISHYDYFHALQRKKEYVKNLQEKTSNWRTELKEALGKDDEVFHPYVEVMPFKDFKQNEAKKNLAGQAMKDGAAENPAQKAVKAKMVGEEARADRGLSTVEKIDRRNKRDEDEDYGADARRKFRQMVLRGKKKSKAHGHKLGEEYLDEAKKSKGSGKPTKKSTNQRKQEEADKKIPKKGAKVSSRTKKAARELDRINKKSQSDATKAREAYRKAHSAYRRGDKVNTLKYEKEGQKHASSAKSGRAAAMRYVPVGSTTYSRPGDPGSMNSKFKRAMSSQKGREDIVRRTFSEQGPTEDQLRSMIYTNRQSKDKNEKDFQSLWKLLDKSADKEQKRKGGGGGKPNNNILNTIPKTRRSVY